MEKHSFPRLLALVCTTLILAWPHFTAASSSEAVGGAWAKEAETTLKTMVDEVLVIIRDPELTAAPEKQEKALYDKAFQIFDFSTFSMLALGPKYREFSPRQREDFIRYFSKLISQTYFPKLAGKDVHNLTINYLTNTPFEPKRGTFRTDLLTELVQGDLTIPIVYRMIRKQDSPWKIYDVKIEGVSMAANYREQYRQQVSSTPDQILSDLKEKVMK